MGAPQNSGFPIREQRAIVDGANLRYLSAGNGPPLVLLHGLLAYAFSWRWIMPELAKHFTVYAPDMLGFGFSDRPRHAAHDLKSAARRILRFLDSENIASCDLMGTSYGGAVAMMAACLAPERFRTLILVDPVNPWSAFHKRRIEWLRRPAVAQLFLALQPIFWCRRRRFLEPLYGDARRIRPGTMEGYETALRIPGTVHVALRILRTWQQDLRALEQLLPAIANIPTLLIWGEMDGAVDPASATQLAQIFRNHRLVIMPGVGHLPYEEWPEELARAVVEFLLVSR